MGVKHLGVLFAVLATCLMVVADAKGENNSRPLALARSQTAQTPFRRLAAKLGITHRRLTDDPPHVTVEKYRAGWFERTFFKRNGETNNVGLKQETGAWMLEGLVGTGAIAASITLLVCWAKLPGFADWVAIGTDTIKGIPGATEIDTFSMLTDTRDTLISQIESLAEREETFAAMKVANPLDPVDPAGEENPGLDLRLYIDQAPAEVYCIFMTFCIGSIIVGLLILGGYKWYWCLVGSFLSMALGVCVYGGYNTEMTQIAAKLQITMFEANADGQSFTELITNLEGHDEVMRLDSWHQLTEWHIAAIVIGCVLAIFVGLGLWRKFVRCEKGFWGPK